MENLERKTCQDTIEQAVRELEATYPDMKGELTFEEDNSHEVSTGFIICGFPVWFEGFSYYASAYERELEMNLPEFKAWLKGVFMSDFYR